MAANDKPAASIIVIVVASFNLVKKGLGAAAVDLKLIPGFSPATVIAVVTVGVVPMPPLTA